MVERPPVDDVPRNDMFLHEVRPSVDRRPNIDKKEIPSASMPSTSMLQIYTILPFSSIIAMGLPGGGNHADPKSFSGERIGETEDGLGNKLA